LGVALTGLFVIGAVAADGQINRRSQYVGTTGAAVDDKEIYTCLPTIGPLIRC
jgi:hypothetical protein